MSVVLRDFIIWTPDVQEQIYARITFIFKATEGWLVIRCHKRGLYKTTDIRLNEQNTEDSF